MFGVVVVGDIIIDVAVERLVVIDIPISISIRFAFFILFLGVRV